MPVIGTIINTYTAFNTKGTIMHYGATRKFTYYTSDTTPTVTCYSTENNVIKASIWNANSQNSFPTIPNTSGVQYDPYNDTFIRNEGTKIVEIDYGSNTIIGSMSVARIEGYDPQNAILLGLGKESYFYYLIKTTGHLYKINRNFTGTPVRVGTIPTASYIATWALGGFFYYDYLYLMNGQGSLVEIPISNPQQNRIVISGLKTNAILFPLLTYHPDMVLNRKMYFTLCAYNENVFQVGLLDFGQPPNQPIPISYIGTQATPFAHGDTKPWLAWNFSDPDLGDKGSAYQVVVMDGITGTIIHDTGKVDSIESLFRYNGPALEWNRMYKWRVKVWDRNQLESVWTNDQYFIPNVRPSVYELTGTVYGDSVTIGLTPRLSFQVVDQDTYPIQGFEISIKQVLPVEKEIIRNQYVESTRPWYDVPAGLLQELSTYSWTVRVKDRFGVWSGQPSAYFTTTSKPPAVFPLAPPNGIRTGFQPTFHAVINPDPTGDHQHFRIQMATDPAFAEIVKTFSTQDDPHGWEVLDGHDWHSFPLNGVRRTRQLVQNADFSIHGEPGPILGWSRHNFWGPPDRLDVLKQASDGSSYLCMINESGKNGWGMRQLLKGWKSGDKLKITLEARIVRMGNAAVLNVMVKSAEGIRLNEKVLSLTTTTDDFQIYVGEIVLPDDQTLDLLFLEIGLDGNQSSSSECQIRSVTAEVLYVVGYQEVRFTPQAPLPSERYYWRMHTISAEQGTVSDPTNERRQVNQFVLSPDSFIDIFNGIAMHYGFDGTSLQYDYQIDLFPDAFPDGSYVIEARAVSTGTQLQLTRGFLTHPGKYYVGMVNVKSNYPAVAIEINGIKGPQTTLSHTWQMLYMKIAGTGGYMYFTVIPLQDAPDQITSLAQVGIFEISKAEYDRIDADPAWSKDNLLLRIPPVQGAVLLSQTRSLSTGEELSFHLTTPVPTAKAANFITLNAVWKHPSDESKLVSVPFDAMSITYENVGGEWMIVGHEATITSGMGSARLTFWGTGIRWYGKKTPHSYIACVLIDDVLALEIDQYAQVEEEVLLYEKTDLPYGQHSITILTTNRYHPQCENPVYRTHIRSFEVLLNEPSASVSLHACNNGFDATPFWEDLTSNLLQGTAYTFANKRKSAAKWGVNIRMIISASGTISPVEVDGFGFSFE